MNLRLLEIFRAVMQSHTTIGAARSLQISQPAVSSAIRQLESQVEFALFDRIGNRLTATEEARILFRESESIFLLSKALNQTVKELKEERLGQLRIVATPQLGHSVLPAAINALLSQRPKVKVFFDVRRSYNVIEIIESGAADIGFAIALEPELNQTLQMLPVARVEMMCLVPIKHPLAKHKVVTPNDLSPYPLIGLEMGSRLSPLVLNAFKQAGTPYRTAIEVRYSETACLLVQAGAGVAIVDWFSATAQIRRSNDLALIPFKPEIEVEAFAVSAKNRTPSRLALLLVEETRNWIRQFSLGC
ncbi:LysR family transcriptional regulator [Bordetella sp. BOR01]|uniref:LysR family transcriptional regulator n=1 Tax=Bordetella sp. BOR01 TaxID=2854779 RepID=UPI001C483556|nr:LysR family transcriptional regulator [Bordetella sp. BOR01]